MDSLSLRVVSDFYGGADALCRQERRSTRGIVRSSLAASAFSRDEGIPRQPFQDPERREGVHHAAHGGAGAGRDDRPDLCGRQHSSDLRDHDGCLSRIHVERVCDTVPAIALLWAGGSGREVQVSQGVARRDSGDCRRENADCEMDPRPARGTRELPDAWRGGGGARGGRGREHMG